MLASGQVEDGAFWPSVVYVVKVSIKMGGKMVYKYFGTRTKRRKVKVPTRMGKKMVRLRHELFYLYVCR